ncbi:membrane protein [Staphylococcus phage JPL-50]|uniref:Membrane protein n=1 Tax=Staphylococcus phage JPL-50 TaxID=2851077 RepID=A0A8F3C9T6_9CAUD|nr:membrane protein [Staphylococcus phage JPL-50]QWY14496.1 membrane protein [Staphylococcus phage JPL-50]
MTSQLINLYQKYIMVLHLLKCHLCLMLMTILLI